MPRSRVITRIPYSFWSITNTYYITILTPKSHKSSEEYCGTIVKKEEGTGSITSVSEIPKVTPFITEWTHKEMFTFIVADIITVWDAIII